MKNKRLIIIHPSQFGKSTDYYKYCEYLRDDFEIIYFCFNEGMKKEILQGISIRYMSLGLGYKIGYLFFILRVCLYLVFHKGIAMIAYCSVAMVYKKILPFREMIINIRSVSVNMDTNIRLNENKLIKTNSNDFDKIIMISDAGSNQLGLDMNKTSIVSLGADIISTENKDFHNINLLYVGTLNNRKIFKTIEGLQHFLERIKPLCNITYDIIGEGDEMQKIANMVSEFGLGNIVKLHGKKPYSELKPFFDQCNIGVSFIPQTDYYEFQPPTKTFEYGLSGMFCIATGTYANRKVISKNNGIIIEDNPNSFSKALTFIYNNKDLFNSKDIQNSMSEYSWKNVIDSQLRPILENF